MRTRVPSKQLDTIQPSIFDSECQIARQSTNVDGLAVTPALPLQGRQQAADKSQLPYSLDGSHSRVSRWCM